MRISDWSSDVCSSDLKATHIKGFEWVIRSTGDVKEYIRANGISIEKFLGIYRDRANELAAKGRSVVGTEVSERGKVYGCDREASGRIATIGRASCREVSGKIDEILVVGVNSKK